MVVFTTVLLLLFGVPLAHCMYLRLDYVKGVREHEEAKARQEEYLHRMHHPVSTIGYK